MRIKVKIELQNYEQCINLVISIKIYKNQNDTENLKTQTVQLSGVLRLHQEVVKTLYTKKVRVSSCLEKRADRECILQHPVTRALKGPLVHMPASPTS